MKFRFIVENQIERGQPALHIVSEGWALSGKRSVALPMVFKVFEEGEDPQTGPALAEGWDGDEGLIDAFLQGALEAAWARGLRPSQATAPETPVEPAPVVNNVVQASDELVEAKDAHIADLRILAFHLAGIDVEADGHSNITEFESRHDSAE